MMKRRELLKIGLAAFPLSKGAWRGVWGRSQDPRYDLLLKGGTVVDPSQGLHAPRDVAVSNGRIAAVEPDLSPSDAVRTVDLAERLITPGLIDLHVHGFEGVSHWGVHLDHYCVTRGVTTAVDAGTSGSDSFEGFRRLVIRPSRTRVLAFLNISRVGLVGRTGELLDARMIDEASALRVAREHEDVIVGIKVRCGAAITGPNDLQALQAARRVADAVGKPLMIHVGTPHTPTQRLLEEARPGDMVTHSFRAAGTGGVTGPDGLVPDYILEAAQRGVLFDLGHGSGGFSFATAEAALEQGLLPSSISSDIHAYSALGPVFDLPTTMSKFLLLGLSVEKVVELATVAPARAIGRDDTLGSLRTGGPADVAAFDLVEGEFSYVDSVREVRKYHRKLVPVLTLRAGKLP